MNQIPFSGNHAYFTYCCMYECTCIRSKYVRVFFFQDACAGFPGKGRDALGLERFSSTAVSIHMISALCTGCPLFVTRRVKQETLADASLSLLCSTSKERLFLSMKRTPTTTLASSRVFRFAFCNGGEAGGAPSLGGAIRVVVTPVIRTYGTTCSKSM